MTRRLQRAVAALAGTGALLAVLVTGCGKTEPAENRGGARVVPAGSGAPAKTYALNYTIFLPTTHMQYKAGDAWAEEVGARTRGRIKIEVRAGESPAEPTKTYDAVVQGTTDIGMGCFSSTRGRFPLLEGLDLPMGYPDAKTATIVANTVVAKYAPKEVDDVHVLYVHAHGPGIIASRLPVAALADFKGLRVSATGLSGRIVEKLGGSAVAMPQSETYDALRKRDVDATFCPAETLKSWRYGEVIESIIPIPSLGYTTAMFVAMNKATWEALPVDLQQILTDVSLEWGTKHGAAWDLADAEGLTFVKELGKAVRFLSPAEVEAARDAVKPILDDYVKTTEAAGLPGAQLLDDIRQQMKDLAAPL